MKKPPLILISGSTASKGAEFGDASLSLSMNYPLAIRAAAGMPWLLPCVPERELVAEAVRRSDGVMLTGGEDVQPSLYSAKLPPAIQKTVHAARGHQILNVALGGTLLADIPRQRPDALNHCRTDLKDKIVHQVTVDSGSLLAQAAGCPSLGVNSSHHQAVANIAKPLRATAVSIDGIIEGLELEPAARRLLPYLVAVQFHPERLFTRHRPHLELFRRFIAACRWKCRN